MWLPAVIQTTAALRAVRGMPTSEQGSGGEPAADFQEISMFLTLRSRLGLLESGHGSSIGQCRSALTVLERHRRGGFRSSSKRMLRRFTLERKSGDRNHETSVQTRSDGLGADSCGASGFDMAAMSGALLPDVSMVVSRNACASGI